MTGMLASVNGLTEARMVLAAGVDIIDMKDPMSGSLGAMLPSEVETIVQAINGHCLTSCTIGDLPMQTELVYRAVKAMTETGIDFVKIGFYPDGDFLAVLKQLSMLSVDCQLIAVLFADTSPDFGMIEVFHSYGFKGVMLDTLAKHRGSLRTVMPLPAIRRFVLQAKARALMCGLAGSLHIEDIPELLSLKPDYLGFRGALCDHNDRIRAINRDSVKRIHHAITESAADYVD